MATTKKKSENKKVEKRTKVPSTLRLTDVEVDAIESGIKALEQKARNIENMGPFATKGPVMRCRYAIYDLRRLLARLG